MRDNPMVIDYTFGKILSFDETDVRVKTPEREYCKHCDAQTGLRSLIGFVMATSDCPVLSSLRGLANYHLPSDLSLDGLKQQFTEIQTVNYDFLQRIRVASQADSSLDVLSTLFSISALISLNLDDYLERLRPSLVCKR